VEKNNLNEADFRKIVQHTLDGIEKAFENVDPDLAECEQSLGSMTISFSDKSRCIISTQPSVRQLWLALAARGTAYHFNWDQVTHQWIDDKGMGIEFIRFLTQFLKEMTGQDLKLSD
jgi:iron donor protein CyaY